MLSHPGRDTSISTALLRIVRVVALIATVLAAGAPQASAHDYSSSTEVNEEHGYCTKGSPTSAIGVVIYYHGGGWRGDEPGVRPPPAEVCNYAEEQYASRRWYAIAPTYTGTDNPHGDQKGGVNAVGDAVRWYEYIRARTDPSLPVCVAGGSAGGHLALSVARFNSAGSDDPDCAISEAAPTDLSDEAFPPNELQTLADLAFGSYKFFYSPVHFTSGLPTMMPTLLAIADCDDKIYEGDNALFRHYRQSTELVIMAQDSSAQAIKYPHGPNCAVRPADYEALQAAIDGTLAQAAAGN